MKWLNLARSPFIPSLLCFLLLIPVPARSADPRKSGTAGEDRKIDELSDALKKRDEVIEGLIRRVDTLEQEVRSLRAAASHSQPPQSTDALRAGSEAKAGARADQKAAPSAQASPTPGRDAREEEEQLAQSALEHILIQQSAALLAPWTVKIEPSLTYAHASSDRVIIDGIAILDPDGAGIVIGEIVSQRVRRDSLLPTLALRIGLPWELQAEAKIPFDFERQTVVTGDFDERDLDNFGLSDVELALSRQIVHEKGWIPDLVGGFRWRTTTGETPAHDLALGTGFDGLQFSLSGAKYSDPLAFFATATYTVNLPATIDGLEVDPGDTWGFNLGMALALNPETSLNFRWDQRFSNHTTVQGFQVPGSELYIGSFRVGFTYTLTRNIFLDLGVEIGMTQDAPDMQAIIAVPIQMPDLFSKPEP